MASENHPITYARGPEWVWSFAYGRRTRCSRHPTNRDGRSGFRRVFDLELASGIESELLGAQFASSRSAVQNTCLRLVSPFRLASMGGKSCSRSGHPAGSSAYGDVIVIGLKTTIKF